MSRSVALLLALAACTPMPEGPFSACDPLDTALCALPFPSSFYLKEADTPTGYQVDFQQRSFPVNRDDVPLDPTLWNEKDGFSISAPLLVWFGDVSLEGVIGHQNLEDHASNDARTVIVNVETGERVPHFVELDMMADYDVQRLLMLRPVVPLDFATRYVVGIRDLEKTDGTLVEVSEAFEALRDDRRTDDYDVEGRRDHFDEVVFPTLEKEGFERDDLQLAWDFVTVSRENTVGRMEWMRDDMYARFGSDGPAYRIDSAVDHDCAAGPIARTVRGFVTVPLYTEEDAPGTMLTRDEDGWPFYNGDAEADFLVRIPCSVAEDPEPSFVLQYGHGLLGSREEANTGWLSRFADERRYVVAATDWTGMSEDDVGEITLMLVTDVSNFAIIPERSMQGYLQALAMTRLVKGGLADDDAVKFEDPDTHEMVSVLDPDRIGFYGNSQGAIMGGALLGMSPDLERGVLGVGGMSYSILLARSYDFNPFFLLFRNKYEDDREIALVLTAQQMLWDASESAGWAHDVNRDPPSGMAAKDVLMQVAIADAQVTTLGSHYQARAYGGVTIAPAVRPIYGVPEVSAPYEGTALVEWYYSDVPDEPIVNVPPDPAYDPHECPRREPEAQRQVGDFLETGVVNQHCEGMCEGIREDRCG
jgi:hypothetical protein